MPRKPREIFAGAVYHVYARGNNKQRIFLDTEDRRSYLAILRAVVKEFGWNVLAYCEMTNHVHLIIETPEPNLVEGMHMLQSAYARRFVKRHQRTGHVFERRYGDKLIRSDAHLQVAVAYVALNPVKAGMCQDPADWPWSSHAAVVGAVGPPTFLNVPRLLEFFAGFPGDPAEYYGHVVSAIRQVGPSNFDDALFGARHLEG